MVLMVGTGIIVAKYYKAGQTSFTTFSTKVKANSHFSVVIIIMVDGILCVHNNNYYKNYYNFIIINFKQ